MPDIKRIQSLFSNPARPNRYRVEFATPQGLASDSGIIEQVNFGCRDIQFPGKSFSTYDSRNGAGPVKKMPYDQIYTPVTATFYNDVNHTERRFFEDWYTLINDSNSNRYEYQEKYISTISIYQMDTEDKDTYAVELFEAYPMTIGEVALGFDQNDAIEVFTVTFTYTSWKRIL